MKKIWKKYWYTILLHCFVAGISNASIVYAGYRLSSVVNGVFGHDITSVTKDTIIVSVAFIIALIFRFLADLVKVSVTKKFNIYLKQIICSKITSLNDQEYEEFKKGDLISWMTSDVDSIGQLCFSSLFAVSSNISAVIFASFAVFTFHWIIGLSLLGVTLLMIILPATLQTFVSKKVQGVSKSKEEFVHRLENLLNGYKIFSYNNDKTIFAKLINKATIKVEKSNASYGVANAVQGFVLFSLFITSQMVMLFVSIFLALNGYTEVGAMLAVTNIAGTFFNGVSGLFGSAFTIKAGTIIFKKFNYTQLEENTQVPAIDFKNLKIKDLNYQFNGRQIFHNLNLEVEQKKKYLVIGESGAGKTTLFKIIFGLIKDYQGEVILNDALNYHQVSESSLKNLIGYLPQDTVIFNDTIKNNVTLFNPNISDETVVKALHQVNLGKWLTAHSLDTQINSETKNLSGGELQRIAIARALVHNKDIMIFDEITANLDACNRELIEKVICELDQTVLYISHTTNEKQAQNFDTVIKL